MHRRSWARRRSRVLGKHASCVLVLQYRVAFEACDSQACCRTLCSELSLSLSILTESYLSELTLRRHTNGFTLGQSSWTRPVKSLSLKILACIKWLMT